MSDSGYLCPYCVSHVDVNDKIVLSAKLPSGKRGIVLLSATIGDYTVEKSKSLHPENGDEVDLHCSVCQHNLIHDEDRKLCKLLKIDEKGEEHTILFSRVWGEQSTFHIEKEKTTSYGEHAIRYQDPEWYMQVDE